MSGLFFLFTIDRYIKYIKYLEYLMYITHPNFLKHKLFQIRPSQEGMDSESRIFTNVLGKFIHE